MMTNFKFYDTSSLLYLKDRIFETEVRFGISSITLKELEGIKNATDRDPEIKYAARHLLNQLYDHLGDYDVITFKPDLLIPIQEKNLDLHNNDIKILACAISYQPSVFVSNDLSLCNIASLFFNNIEIIGYHKNDNYVGYKDIMLDDNQMADFYSDQTINWFENQINEYVIIRNSEDEIVDRLVWTGETYRRLRYSTFDSKWFGAIKPLSGDVYQACAADSLINNQLTMLKGPAGSGKTILSLGYLFHLLDRGKIDRIIVFCNTVATKNSARLGFYPGTRNEKLLDSQIGNLLISKLGGRLEVERLIDEERLILLPLSDIRGYETPAHSGVYISEAQNLDIDLMQLALTRIGPETVCIIDGDDKTQVDLPAYAGDLNGMKKVSKIYRGCDKYGEIELKFIHRSEIASLAQKLTQ